MKLRFALAALAALFMNVAVNAQEAAAAPAPPTGVGEKFGVSDSMILYLLVGIAIVLTIIILTVTSAIQNLANSRELWKGKNLSKIPGLLLVLGFLQESSVVANAYPGIKKSAYVLDETTFWVLIIADAVLFGIAMYYLLMLKRLTSAIRGETSVEPAFAEEEPTWLDNLLRKATDAVPVEREVEVLTDHEYDGIRELDNNLPPWWKWMFYVTIVWSVVYVVYYHMLNGPSSAEEYQTAMDDAKAQVDAYITASKQNVDEKTVEINLEASALADGKVIYDKNCVACHAADGGGGVGPNFTDQYWIHGGSIKDIFRTIKYGVPQKGMIPWQDQLTPVQMQNVASYITTLVGTTPAVPKDPQGDLYVPEAVPAENAAPADSLTTPAAPADSAGVANTDANPQATMTNVK